MGIIVFLKRIGLISLASGCSMNIEHSRLITEYRELIGNLYKYMTLITSTAFYSYVSDIHKVMIGQFAPLPQKNEDE